MGSQVSVCVPVCSVAICSRLSPPAPPYLIANRMLTFTAIISVMTPCAVRTVHTKASNRATKRKIIEKKYTHNEYILSHTDQRRKKLYLFFLNAEYIRTTTGVSGSENKIFESKNEQCV